MRALGDAGRAGGGAPAGLRRHHPGPAAALPVAGRRSAVAWGAPSYNPPSRFLDEVPGRDLVDWRRAGRRRGPRRRPPPAVARLVAAARRPVTRQPAIIHLEPGDRVTHDSFGLGSVVQVEGAGDSAMAHVDFGDDGVKRLLLRYAPVEKL